MSRPVQIASQHFNEFSALNAHEVLKITLPGGAQFAVDFTGLQMGWRDTIVPWETYQRRHVHRIHVDVTANPGLGDDTDAVQTDAIIYPIEAMALGIKDERQTRLMETVVANSIIPLFDWKDNAGERITLDAECTPPTLTLKEALHYPEADFHHVKAGAVNLAKHKLDTLADAMEAEVSREQEK